jgi:hypothetical protein
MAVSAIILTCCTVVKIRLVIYFACGFLVFFGIICFGLLIFFSMVQPVVTQACSYSDRYLSTGADAKTLFVNLGFPEVGNSL